MKKILQKLLFFCLLLCATTANAANSALVVKNGNDSGDNSLRDVITNANDGDVITFDASVTNITLANQISFDQANLTIDGGGIVTISGNASLPFRLFNSTAASGVLTLRGLRMENGNLTGADEPGGAVYIAGDAALTNCTFANNKGMKGGAVYVTGNITLTNCIFAGNNAGNGGGGLFAEGNAELTDCTFIGNTAIGNGGAVYTASDAVLNNCTFTGNGATTFGGAVYAWNNLSLNACGFTKNTALYSTAYSDNGDINADNTSFADNSIHSDDLGITGILQAGTDGNINLRHCTFTNNKKIGSGIVYNICTTGTLTAQNCLMTQDGLNENWNGGAISGDNDLDGTYTAKFNGNNILTFNYIMPYPTAVDNATLISELETDAAGNIRTAENCLYGAINRTAASLMVSHSLIDNDGMSGIGSLRYCVAIANTAPAASDKTVIYFADNLAGGNTIMLTAGEITLNKDIMIIGHLNIDGKPAITINANDASRAFNYNGVALGTVHFYGLNITNGNSGASGGGIFSSNGTVAANHCNFTNNTASVGGGLFASAAMLTNCSFTGNMANQRGGGVYTANASTLNSCYFVDNTADENGGGLYANTTVALNDCTFANNTATSSGNSNGNGGGIYANNTANVENCIFIGNTANFGGGIYTSANGELALNSCTFAGNTVNYSGGAMFLRNTATLSSCTVTGNTADTFSGGIYAYSSPLLMIINSTISGNITGSGGSCAIESSAKIYLFHSTITNNKGGGVYVASEKSAYLYNSIITGNTNVAGAELLQINGNGNIQDTGSLIEDVDNVTHRQVFGLNTIAGGIHKVLGNGIAVGTAEAISEEFISELADLNAVQQAAVIIALTKDQTGAIRAAEGNVTYGAVEASANTLNAVAVKTGTSVKTVYELNETLDFTDGKLTLTYSNGTEYIDMTETGVTNDAEENITESTGSKEIRFTFLGITTDAGLFITVKDEFTGICPTTFGSPAPLTVYPNPTRGELMINSSTSLTNLNEIINKIEVFNLQGKLILQPTTNPFDISTLPEGIYMVKVNGETVKVVKK